MFGFWGGEVAWNEGEHFCTVRGKLDNFPQAAGRNALLELARQRTAKVAASFRFSTASGSR